MFLSKTEITPAYEQTIPVNVREPFFNWRASNLTVQVQNGRQTHQLAFMELFFMPRLATGDELEIRIVRKRTSKTWLGKLLERYVKK